ncbi:MAG: ABC transporter ATP-binding protein [Candidatus Hydrothermarchaeota archaeon]
MRWLLEVKGVTKRFGGLIAVNNVSLKINEGEIIGLVGPNGAGKTTLVNIISGIYRPDSGEVLFKGEKISGLKPNQICKKGIARTFQSVQTFTEMSAIENVMLGSLFGRSEEISKEEARERAYEILEFIGFPNEKVDLPVGNLNFVELKSIQLARALATDPDLMLLDEVTTGLNPTEGASAVKLIHKIRKRGITILMIEHIMRIIMGVSDRIVVLSQGEKIAEGTPKEVSTDERVIESYLGERFLW